MPLLLVEPVEKMINKDIRYRPTAQLFSSVSTMINKDIRYRPTAITQPVIISHISSELKIQDYTDIKRTAS